MATRRRLGREERALVSTARHFLSRSASSRRAPRDEILLDKTTQLCPCFDRCVAVRELQNHGKSSRQRGRGMIPRARRPLPCDARFVRRRCPAYELLVPRAAADHTAGEARVFERAVVASARKGTRAFFFVSLSNSWHAVCFEARALRNFFFSKISYERSYKTIFKTLFMLSLHQVASRAHKLGSGW